MSRQSTSSSDVTAAPQSTWGRGRLIAIVMGATAVAVAAMAGALYAVHAALTGTGAVGAGEAAPPSVEEASTAGSAHRDRVAAEPMLEVPDSAAQPQPPGPGGPTAPILVPVSGGVVGPAFVRSGFPATPAGAVGQLVEIGVAALQTVSVAVAQDIYRSWALPGGVPAQGWWIAESLEQFLAASGTSGEVATSPQLTVEPAAALVKGSDGPDWVTVCVLHRVTATLQEVVEEVALGHCERMQWVGGRWMIAPGDAPAPAPATWPGTRLAVEAGWRPWLPMVDSEGLRR